jgi:hypothetical protein
MVCGEVFRESDQIKPIRCATPSCPGVYCQQCFDDLENLCTVCLSPIEYGDMSDISEERYSTTGVFPVELDLFLEGPTTTTICPRRGNPRGATPATAGASKRADSSSRRNETLATAATPVSTPSATSTKGERDRSTKSSWPPPLSETWRGTQVATWSAWTT